MKTVAITGRSGCGKSTVAEYYRNRGFPVLDGDAIAREVTQPGSPCLPALAAKVLRAKIDMAHPNMLFRDPIMYRIIHAEHHRTGNKWWTAAVR